MRHFLAAAALAMLALLPGQPATAADYQAGSLRVGQPWARATAPMAKAGAVFFPVTNAGSAPDTLIAAAGTIADRVELHTHVMENGVMRMGVVDGGVTLPAGATVTLAPGGLHVMLLGLRQPLVQGARFPLTLTFAQAGTVAVDVEVGAAGAGAAPMAHSH